MPDTIIALRSPIASPNVASMAPATDAFVMPLGEEDLVQWKAATAGGAKWVDTKGRRGTIVWPDGQVINRVSLIEGGIAGRWLEVDQAEVAALATVGNDVWSYDIFGNRVQDDQLGDQARQTYNELFLHETAAPTTPFTNRVTSWPLPLVTLAQCTVNSAVAYRDGTIDVNPRYVLGTVIRDGTLAAPYRPDGTRTATAVTAAYARVENMADAYRWTGDPIRERARAANLTNLRFRLVAIRSGRQYYALATGATSREVIATGASSNFDNTVPWELLSPPRPNRVVLVQELDVGEVGGEPLWMLATW